MAKNRADQESNYIHINVIKIKVETDKAFLCMIEQDDKKVEVWIAKSRMADPDDYSRGDKNCTISITEWLAKTLGLI